MNRHIRVIETFGHNGRVGVLVELQLRDDFAARTPEFTVLAKDIAVHIAAANPESVESLLKQQFVKDPTVTVEELLASVSHALADSIVIARFVRWDNEPVAEGGLGPNAPAVAMRRRA
jgi:elongation factor Ts